MLLKAVIALCALVALEFAGRNAHGQMQMQAMEPPQQRELYDHHDQNQSPPDEDQSVHHQDLDNRGDLLGVEQDLLRGATKFFDPGYRDLPNAAQMQSARPVDNDHLTATGDGR